MKQKLTIAIPTYNRFEKLQNTLRHLRVMICDDVLVEVFDNASDFTEQQWLQLKGENPGVLFRKNAVNIGLAGNFIQCFSSCSTDWIWILSDDDQPEQHAIETLLTYINQYPDSVFINFNSNLSEYSGVQQQTAEVKGIQSLVENFTSFPNLLFISTSIYKAAELKHELKSSYYFHNTFAPHLALLFAYLRKREKAACILSKDYIIKWEKPDATHKWNEGLLVRSIIDLVYLLPDAADRRILLKKIDRFHTIVFRSYLRLLKNILLANKENERELISEYYNIQVFLYWTTRPNTIFFLLSIIAQTAGILLFRFKLFKICFTAIKRPNMHLSTAIYNRYKLYSDDKRL